MRRVVVTGLGCVSPLGLGAQRTWSRLLAGESGIVSTDSLGEAFRRLPSRVAGLVPTGGPGAWIASQHARRGEDRDLPLFTRYALAASHEALQDARLLCADGYGSDSSLDWQPDAPALNRVGVSIGSGIGDLTTSYKTSLGFAEKGHHAVHPLFVPRLLLNMAAGHVALRYGLRGPNLCPTSACTTGAHAIADAFHRLAHPHSTADVFVAGASEACIHPLALSGFARARALSTSFNDTPEAASRPFDADRGGFVIAEGAAVLVLESLSSAQRRGARIYAELVGAGESCDAFHVTAPPPDGSGAAQAMRAALALADVSPRQVGYVNAHATGTAVGDAAENAAMVAVLGDGGRPTSDLRQVAVSSTKGATGHLLGAAGSLEALVAVRAVAEQAAPPTLNLERLDGDGPAWPFDYVRTSDNSKQRDVEVALSNSFGFGGTNASLAFRRWEG